MWSKFASTITYFGGKRALVKEIFTHVPAVDKAPIFIDAFMGGGVVSLFAKAKGYRVFSNDISERSYIIAKALIENSDAKLTNEDLLRLFAPNKNDGFVETNYGGKIFTYKVARFIDTAKKNIESFPDHKKYLALLLIMKFCQKVRPFSLLSSTKNIAELDKGNYEVPLSHKSNGKGIIKQVWHPYVTLYKLMGQINKGIFDNGHMNHVYKGDVFDFIKQVQGDVVYFDPPYAETISYEQAYKVLDSIILGKKGKPDPSNFSKTEALMFHERLYKSAQHIPHWVISMGQMNEKSGITAEELLKVVKKYRPKAQSRKIDHKWASKNSAKKSQKELVEYIIFT